MTENPKGLSLINKFYADESVRLTIPKSGRDKLWNHFSEFGKALESEDGFSKVKTVHLEILNAMRIGGSLQRSVFSECIFAHDLATHLGLSDLVDCEEGSYEIPDIVLKKLSEISMKPRYIYLDSNRSQMLIQAGGPNSVDALYFDLATNENIKIEFKEAAAKTSEPDLDYDENGFVQKTKKMIEQYPQFIPMLDEALATSLNIFILAESQTKNYINFTDESILFALDTNFEGERAADVICTEDSKGHLVMMLPQDLTRFVDPIQSGKASGMKGEIRSAGRNHYSVWSVSVLLQEIQKLEGSVDEQGMVTLPSTGLSPSYASGNENLLSRYKLNSIFFVRPESVVFGGLYAKFKLSDVRQIKSTISAHMFFRKLDVSSVREHYETQN